MKNGHSTAGDTARIASALMSKFQLPNWGWSFEKIADLTDIWSDLGEARLVPLM